MAHGIKPELRLRVAAIGLIVVGLAAGTWYRAAAVPPAPANQEAAGLPTPVSPLASATPRPTLASSPLPTATVVATSRPASPTATATSTPAPVTHSIKSGEILLVIAAEYGVSIEAIMALNPTVDPTTLQIGQKLLIPITATPAPPPAATSPPKPTQELLFQTIQAGDTLLALALQFDVPLDLILMVNPMLDPLNLQIGQKVLIPPADGDLPDPVTWAPQIEYQVEAGDTLLDIALANGSSLEDILAVNPRLQPTTLLQIGQVLKVPLTRPRPRANPGGGAASSPNRSAAPALSAADVAALKSGSPTLVGLEEAMVRAVNAQRAAYGLAPYAVDAQLTTLAWSHAHDMVGRGYFSHVTPEGSTLRDRFRSRNMPINWVGENIYLSVKPADQAVAATINWFMADAPHRANILHQNFNRVGVGVAQGESGWYAFVLDFAGD